MAENTDRRFWTPEFVLVCVMLFVLLALVIAILWAPIKLTNSPNDLTFQNVAEYRKTILSVIITAFGAWVGAGAAYFFGRENLRTAAESLLAMREASPQEKLRQTPIAAIPPRPIDWLVQHNTSLEEVVNKFRSEPTRWFLVVTATDGKLETVLHEQAIWRFINDSVASGTSYADILKKQVGDVLTFLASIAGLARDRDIAVSISLDKNVGDAYQQMLAKKVFLAVIVDTNGKPLQFIDTADVRNVLFGSGG